MLQPAQNLNVLKLCARVSVSCFHVSELLCVWRRGVHGRERERGPPLPPLVVATVTRPTAACLLCAEDGVSSVEEAEEEVQVSFHFIFII